MYQAQPQAGVCRYFLQGRCTYGNRCRFRHPPQGESYVPPTRESYEPRNYSNQRIDQSRYNWRKEEAPSKPPQSQPSPEEHVSIISADMTEWIRGGQWPFSCYAFVKYAPVIEGFDDQSPEELRIQAYQANADGNGDVYKNVIDQMSREWKEKVQKLMRPDYTMKQKMLAEIRSLVALTPSDPMVSPSTFPQAHHSQPLPSFSFRGASAGSPTQSPLFNQPSFPQHTTPPQQQTVFGAGNQTTLPQQPVFGTGNQTTLPQQPVFGTGNQSTLPQQPVFGAGNQTTLPQQPVFGTGNQTTLPPQPVFGTGNQTTLPPQPVFGTSNQTMLPQQPVFGAGNQTTLPQQPLFGAGNQAATNAFGQQGPSLFGQQPASTIQHQHQATTGHQQPANLETEAFKNSILGKYVIDEEMMGSVYTAEGDLTDDEKEQFLLSKFTLGAIPNRPPPKEYCS